MAHSHVNSRTALAALLLLGLLGPAWSAESTRCAEKIVLSAVPLDIDYRNNKARFRDVVITQCDLRIEAAEANVAGGLDFENGEWTVAGNVRINAEGGKLRSDKAVVRFRDNLISQATITGTPAEFEQERKDGTLSRGHASTISYEPGSGVVKLRDNAWLSTGCNELKSDQLVYNIKTQRVEGQPQAVAGSSGRITITIQPKGESGSPNPCAKPGTEKSP
jgi:lipopolysaccharide transport protein LptA